MPSNDGFSEPLGPAPGPEAGTNLNHESYRGLPRSRGGQLGRVALKPEAVLGGDATPRRVSCRGMLSAGQDGSGRRAAEQEPPERCLLTRVILS